VNPSFGDGGAEGDGTDRGDDSSGPADASASLGDGDASADEAPSIDTSSSAGETGASRPCCFAHGEIGCEDRLVEECVCKGAPDCCDIGWHEACVDKARTFCSAECAIDEGPLDTSDTVGEDTGASDASETSRTDGSTSDDESTGAPSVNCCAGHEAPGCGDLETEECVCVTNGFAYCCSDTWDAACVDAAVECGIQCVDM
jgi:hypothetical protein